MVLSVKLRREKFFGHNRPPSVRVMLGMGLMPSLPAE
jgi:hypothetical protein